MGPPGYDELHHTTIDPSRRSSDNLSPSTAAHPETASIVTEVDPAQQDPKRSFKSFKAKSRRCKFDLGDSWTWEIGSAALSVVGNALLVGFLVNIHDKPYADWQYTVAPNTVVSIISAVTKAALLTAVSSCLGQLKWKSYERPSSAPLERMQIIDEASRGSWGALKVLSRMASGSKMGILTFSGAVLTFLAVAVDPFAQQILSFPSRQVQASNETAFIQSAHNYTVEVSTEPYYKLVDSGIKAFYRAMSLPDTGLQAQCTTEKCSYPKFVSLGICSKCEDVTERTTQECVGTVLPSADRALDMNCTYTAPYEYTFTASLDDMKTGGYPYNESSIWLFLRYLAFYSRTPDENGYIEKEGYEIFDIETPIFSFLAANQKEDVRYTSQNTTAWPPKPPLTECAIYWCEKEYAPSNFSATSDPIPVSRTQRLIVDEEVSDPHSGYSNYTLVPPPGLISLSNMSSTYHISQSLTTRFVPQLAGLFNGSKPESFYDWPILVSNNLTDVVKSLSTSLTDAIRSGDVNSRISGKAFRTETYIHVRWPWIILPSFVVLASTILLIATTLATRNTVLWKNSLLPFLRSYFDTSTVAEDDSIPLRSVDGVTRG